MIGSLQRTFGGVENLGHLGVGRFVVVTHCEDRTLFRRQLDNLFLQDLFYLPGGQCAGVRLTDQQKVRVVVVIQIQQFLFLLNVCQRFVYADS